MPKYSVNVCRIGYGNRNIVVEAKTAKQAKKKALAEAGSYEFSEHTSDYTVVGIRKVD